MNSSYDWLEKILLTAIVLFVVYIIIALPQPDSCHRHKIEGLRGIIVTKTKIVDNHFLSFNIESNIVNKEE